MQAVVQNGEVRVKSGSTPNEMKLGGLLLGYTRKVSDLFDRLDRSGTGVTVDLLFRTVAIEVQTGVSKRGHQLLSGINLESIET